MKHYLLIIVLALSFSGLFASNGYDVNYSQPQPGVYELNFDLGNYDLNTITHEGVTFSKIAFEGSVFTQLSGYAELPFINASVQLTGNKNVSLKVVAESYEDISLNNPMLPSRGVIYRDQDPSTIPYEIAESSLRDDWYPQNLAQNTQPFIIKDLRGTTIYVYPFRYNAVQNVLRVYNSVTVQLVENETQAINPLPKEPEAVLREMHSIYQTLFINYAEASKDLTIGGYGDILVLCTSRDEDAIVPYVEWKMDKGFNVETQTVATGTNVKTIVQNAYASNNNLLYVQLVGDWADIKSDIISNNSAPTDPQLGCVVGSDDQPDICIGRFSANSAADVTVMVDKVINYEKNPDMTGTWYKGALGVGSSEGSGIGDDGEMDKDHIQVIYDDKYDPFTFDDYYTAYDPGASSQQVSNAVTSGVSAINYCGHGYMQGWSTSGFSNSQVAGLTNGNMLPFIISVACNNGDMHNGTCFGEAWTRKANGGAIMFLGGSISQPWTPPMRGQDYFADLLIGGYDYSAHPGQNGISSTEGRTTLGSIIFNGLVLMTTESGSNSDWETAKTWIYFGDPSLQVRTDTPGDLNLSSYVVLVGAPFSTTVTGPNGPVEGAMLCLSQNGEYFSAITDASGAVSFDHTLAPGTATLVVTAFNMETIYDEVTVVPPGGAYVVVNTCEVDDSNGNNNGQADYGETVLLDIAVENVGTDDATGVDAILTSTDPFVTILDDNHNYGTIAAGAVVAGNGAFEILVSEDTPDNYMALFEIEFTDDSDASWVSTTTVTFHAAVIGIDTYTIMDPTGNNNGKIDPGETVDISIEIMNSGSSDAYNIMGDLSCVDPFITIVNGSQSYGNVTSGSTSVQTFSISADATTPAGYAVTFDLILTGDMSLSATGSFEEVIGQIPVLIIDLDGNANSASVMQDAIATAEITAEYMTSFPEDLGLYSTLFVCLGIYSDNHVLSTDEGQDLADFLNSGGNLYMEGGDTWYYDSQTAVHSMFSVNPTSDGSSDLGTVMGLTGTFTEGMSFNYSGDNSWIDHIEPAGSAVMIFENQSPGYGTAVANDAGSYKTIASSHEFGGLDDGTSPSTKEELMMAYLEFFGFDNSLQAMFVSNTTEICENEIVEFSDMSNGNVISWEWTFEGGSPSTSTFQNPMVMYAVSGTYDVTLTVSDGNETHSVTMEDYIVVNVCTGINDVNIEKICIHPNPNNGIFTLSFDNVLKDNVTLKVFNTIGNLVFVEDNITTEGTFTKKMDLSDLNKGMYFLVIENYQGSTVNRIIIR
ncbi:MAG: T9SS type A sorting domain-containing protein [Bacteroidales bacterium]|nr:T9SS type A sorting domain-containing protein [Bacteroidales bacterium]MCF8404926.1 T9SS type A sorting domain-containing protein [Bacteroidales bacterium]